MTSLRYLCFAAIRDGRATTIRDLIAYTRERQTHVEDVIHGLKAAGAIQRHPGSFERKQARYEAVPGAVVPQDGRGKKPNSAIGRKMGQKVSTANRTGKKRTPLPKPAEMHALEQAWPSVVRVAAWRST